jgi:hypothetical protein
MVHSTMRDSVAYESRVLVAVGVGVVVSGRVFFDARCTEREKRKYLRNGHVYEVRREHYQMQRSATPTWDEQKCFELNTGPSTSNQLLLQSMYTRGQHVPISPNCMYVVCGTHPALAYPPPCLFPYGDIVHSELPKLHGAFGSRRCADESEPITTYEVQHTSSREPR